MFDNSIIQSDISSIYYTLNEDNKYFYNKTILVTGGTGLISSYLILYLKYLNDKKEANIDIIVNVRSKKRFEEKLNVDLSTFKIIEKPVQDLTNNDIGTEQLDLIFHLAGSSSPYAIQNHPTDIIEANVTGTLNVLKIAKQYNAKVYYSSTREVYGETEGIQWLKEDSIGITDHTKIRSCYPESKRMAENLIISYQHEYNVEYVMNRIARVYGPGMAISNDGRIMSDLVGNVVNGEDIALLSDGSALRAFCYITDAITGILLSVVKGHNAIYNLANETEELSILDLSELLINVRPELNLKVAYVPNEQKQDIGYLAFKRVGLDTNQLETIGWKPNVNLKEGLKRTVEFYL